MKKFTIFLLLAVIYANVVAGEKLSAERNTKALPTTYQQFAPELHGINQVATDEVFFRHISSENMLPQVTFNSSSQLNQNTAKHGPSQAQIKRFELAKDAGIRAENFDTFTSCNFGYKNEWELYLEYITNKENPADLAPYKIAPEKIAFPLINGEIGEDEKQLFNQILNDSCLVEVKTEAQFLEQTDTIEKAFPKHEINFDRFEKYRKILPPRDMIKWEKKDNKINIKYYGAKNNGLKDFIKK